MAQLPHGCALRTAFVRTIACCLGGMAILLARPQPVLAQFAATQSLPPPSYFQALSVFWDGDYTDALKMFKSEWNGAYKNGTNRWVDSVCYHTMMGECFYQMGKHDLALEQYNYALQLAYTYSDWMLRVQFAQGIRPASGGQYKQVPWGVSTRAARWGLFPDTMPVGRGQIDNNAPYRQGGVVQQAMLIPVNIQEIIRCTSLAMRHRREVMGPACTQDQLTNELIAAYSRRPGPPNHWSEAWIDLQLGLAYAAGGKDAQARVSLERAVVAGGEFDHPLTSTALLELGRMSFAAGDFVSAANLFAEASYSAGVYFDPIVAEEALRYGQLTHLVSNRPGMYAPLAAAAAWARANNLRHMQVSMLVLAAENACTLGDPASATNLLGTARAAMGRRALATGKVNARLNFITALAAYQQGNISAGDQAVAAALAFQRTGSLWLFHISLSDSLYLRGAITSRVAMEVFSIVLRDPTAADWATDPLESLSSMVVPHPAPYEHWFEVAIDRKDHERVLEISDLARRHDFLTTLDLGGRIHNLRWLLECPDESLDATTRLQRQDLLNRYGAYEQLRQQSHQLHAELERVPLAPTDPQAIRTQQDNMARLAQISAAQEKILREIAVRREPCALVFPPFRTTKEIKAALEPNQAVLSFFTTARQSYAILLTHEKYGYWKVPREDMTARSVIKLLQSLGNYDQNRVVTIKELQANEWKETARQILESLTKDSRADLRNFKQLVIVPDGVLWYLPFEALQIREGDKYVSLISKMGIRYAPLASLGVGDLRPRNLRGSTAIVLGKAARQADQEAIDTQAYEELERTVTGAVGIRPPYPSEVPVYASLFDGLIALVDTQSSDDEPYSWSPIPADRSSATGALANWFPLPWGGPEFVVLPSFHTAAERALKKQGRVAPGHEVFLSVCAMMANGARTVLLSRWRTGGQTSVDLVREFVQELPHATACESWQRSLMLASEQTLDAALEPRLKLSKQEEAPKADHPFFWAGYLLVDTGALPSDRAPPMRNPEPDPAAVIENAPPANPAGLGAVPPIIKGDPPAADGGKDAGAEKGAEPPKKETMMPPPSQATPQPPAVPPS